MNLIIRVWDSIRQEWRGFSAENSYKIKCGNGLHQFGPYDSTCSCRIIKSGIC